MLADRQKAVDDSGEKTSPAEKLEEQSSGKPTVNQTNSDMERMLWAAFMLMPAPPEKQMPMPEDPRFRGAPPAGFGGDRGIRSSERAAKAADRAAGCRGSHGDASTA